MGCATGVVKYLVFLANLLFALAGLALLIVGILFKLNIKEATEVLPGDFELAPILSIIIGAIVFVTAFLGCCGAVKESPCMLTTFSIILLTIFIIQVAIAVYAFIQIKNEDQFKREIQGSLQKIFDKRDTNSEANETLHSIEKWVHCCGVEGPNNYPSPIKPSSCCENSNNNGCEASKNQLFTEGCTDKVFRFVLDKSKIVGGVAIGIAAIEVLGAVFGLCLASSIRNHYRRHLYT